MTGAAPANRKTSSVLGKIAVWGPGLLVMLADTDAGNVVTGAQAGAAWGYRFLPLLLLLIPMLYMVQELTVRLGIFTGRGYGELIRIRFGAGWAWLSLLGLAAAVIGSLVTEFTGVAGIGELLWSFPRADSAARGHDPARDRRHRVVSAGGAGRHFRRTVRARLLRRGLGRASEPCRAPRRRRRFADPGPRLSLHGGGGHWSGFQPLDDLLPAVGDRRKKASTRRLQSGSAGHGVRRRADAMLDRRDSHRRGGDIGQERGLHRPRQRRRDQQRVVPGARRDDRPPRLQCGCARGLVGRSDRLFAGARLGRGRDYGLQALSEYHPFAAKWFYGVYALCVVGSAVVVGLARDLVWLNIAAQALNAFLLPLVIGLLVALAVKALPEAGGSTACISGF